MADILDKEDTINTFALMVYMMGSFCFTFMEVGNSLSIAVGKLGLHKAMEIFNAGIDKGVRDFIDTVDLTHYYDLQDFVDRNMDTLFKLAEANINNVRTFDTDTNVLVSKKFIEI